mmetsp:Transcript_47190/g.78300  ORF Transcript_47190/g.78300 Transcript_47190/m.78300 type:complete len:135 (-) Transcript_47190:229-633(-)|eukprot:CAMPEP_0202712392 /NCGR_PEP_ID=MMETSP1385-20130828/39663_1 /ASSEMBLY_ACC=CAM_ASM_000861 /TAXON_ID=933848 /ORGANISM="Elphidium margaritaceum" /LENGTH=134 /DNA_ID=CAMNT_0049372413 /DNA_START=43 /DNA_END=447 /DNA_ORIENTATION=-
MAWQRIVAQMLVTAGSVFARAFAQALQQAQHQGKSGNAKEAADRLLGKMDAGQARKILNMEKPYTAEQITQQFENIFKYNDPKTGGSYYLQCKAEHAKNTLHEEFAKQYEQEMTQETPIDEHNETTNENTSSRR